ncbi:hypothetical protein CGZ60_00585 [Neisseria animalis]|nr:hypothetical protein CGZ60_00585 [Neisseria animalis]
MVFRQTVKGRLQNHVFPSQHIIGQRSTKPNNRAADNTSHTGGNLLLQQFCQTHSWGKIPQRRTASG